jgi:hypothetical protein
MFTRQWDKKSSPDSVLVAYYRAIIRAADDFIV